MDQKELDKIRKRCFDSTKGKWIPMLEGLTHESGSNFIMSNVRDEKDYNNPNRGPDIELIGRSKEDIIFIANAKQDILNLLNEIERLMNVF